MYLNVYFLCGSRFGARINHMSAFTCASLSVVSGCFFSVAAIAVYENTTRLCATM